MTRYARRIDEFEAVQWSGSNWHEMLAFGGRENVSTDGKALFLGPQVVPAEWWVLRNQNGVLSVCDPTVFGQMYEEVIE